MKRQYTHIITIEDEIVRLRKEGRTRLEIANILGLSKLQAKNWVSRYNKRQIKETSVSKKRTSKKKSNYQGT